MSAPSTQTSPRVRLLALGVVATLVLFLTGALFAANANADITSGKVWVCKYVGIPGDDERLSDGNNPIDVSVNAIPADPVQIGSVFADQQGRSFVIAVQENPSDTYDGEDCPETPPGNGTE